MTKGSSSGASCPTATIILSRRTQLKAFLKSIFKARCPGCKLWRKIRLAWTAASAHKGTPNPSWWGAKSDPVASFMQAPAHLATRRQSVQPTAIGLTPPPILFSAKRVAPKKEARGGAVVLPLSTKFTKKVSRLEQHLPTLQGWPTCHVLQV